MDSRSPSRLIIPSPSPQPWPAAPMNNVHGRPSLWSNSTTRRTIRLYLFTTLPLQKILDVVFHPYAPDSRPGKDSANKQINAYLDVEPRWLRPKNDSEMIRRCEQLGLSPIRNSPSRYTRASARQHSFSAPPQLAHGSSTPIKQEPGASSSTLLEVPSWNHSPVGPFTPLTYDNIQGGHSRSVSDDLSNRLTRVNTALTSSTDQTTRSFQDILADKGETCIQLVKKIVRQYTAPFSDSGLGMSPASAATSFEDSWYRDPISEPAPTANAHVLPGDCLNVDLRLQQENPCSAESVEHQNRWCMCHYGAGMTSSPWVTAYGLTPLGVQILTQGPLPPNINQRDDLGNTVLHFLAARAQKQLLHSVLHSQICGTIVNETNTAGQTFLHVLGESWYHNADALSSLFEIVSYLIHQHKFDLSARDCYGRTVFHMLASSNASRDLVAFIFQRHCHFSLDRPDAFGLRLLSTEHDPVAADLSNHYHDLELSDTPYDARLRRDADYLRVVVKARDSPLIQDSEGRNGLHCLAMATLSKQGVLAKSQSSPNQLRPRKRAKSNDERLDSSEERLTERFHSAQGLLQAGVDPNHYDKWGNTPLMAFCAELPEDDDYKTGPAIIKLLIDRGADMEARNRAGETALHIAVRCGRKLAVRTLVQCGANVHVRDAAGRGLLVLADVKMKTCSDDAPYEYSHIEACRAFLSGNKGMAVQEPTFLQEWGSS